MGHFEKGRWVKDEPPESYDEWINRLIMIGRDYMSGEPIGNSE